MTREEALEKLVWLQMSVDIESAHIEADHVLCKLLESIGYKDVVDAYHKVDKWYS